MSFQCFHKDWIKRQRRRFIFRLQDETFIRQSRSLPSNIFCWIWRLIVTFNIWRLKLSKSLLYPHYLRFHCSETLHRHITKPPVWVVQGRHEASPSCFFLSLSLSISLCFIRLRPPMSKTNVYKLSWYFSLSFSHFRLVPVNMCE